MVLRIPTQRGRLAAPVQRFWKGNVTASYLFCDSLRLAGLREVQLDHSLFEPFMHDGLHLFFVSEFESMNSIHAYLIYLILSNLILLILSLFCLPLVQLVCLFVLRMPLVPRLKVTKGNWKEGMHGVRWGPWQLAVGAHEQSGFHGGRWLQSWPLKAFTLTGLVTKHWQSWEVDVEDYR